MMEAIERYCGMFQGDEIRTTRRFVDFPTDDANFLTTFCC
jgi:ribosomal protein S12 methylthiotransferase accessory factor